MYRKCYYSLLIAALISLNGACSSDISEKEGENNALSAPQTIAFERFVVGSLHPKTDKDYYTISVSDPTCFSGSLKGMKGIDHRLTLYWTDGKTKKKTRPLLVVDGAPVQADEVFYTIGVNPGYLFAVVDRSPKDAGSEYDSAEYKLQLTKTDCPGEPGKDFESEPNSRITAAQNLFEKAVQVELDEQGEPVADQKVSGKKTGLFQTVADQKTNLPDIDYYQLKIGSGKFVLTLAVNPAGQFDPLIELYKDGGKKPIFFGNRGGIGEKESISSLLLEAGSTYQVAVLESEGKASADFYELAYTLEPWQADKEWEPNTDFKQAVPMKDGVKMTAGLLSWQDVDSFNFRPDADADEDDRYTFSLKSPSKWRTKIEMYFSPLNSAEFLKDSDASEFVLPAIKIPAGKAVFFRIQADATDNQTQTEYEEIFYQLEMKKKNWPKPVESEPNNSSAKATKMNDDNVLLGFISDRTDEDYFDLNEWEISQNQKLILSGVDGLVLELTLYNDAGKEMASKKSPGPGNKLTLKTKAGMAMARIKAASFVEKESLRKYKLTYKD